MGLISYTISNLSSGVSQQPPALSLPSSLKELVNGWPSVVSGLQKRPPSEHIASVTGSIQSGAAAHLINRNSGYQYIVVVSNGDLQVIDLLTGVKQTVNFPEGKSYLSLTTSPIDSFKFATVGDFTFVLNKDVVVQPFEYGEGSSAYIPTGTVEVYSSLPSSPSNGVVYFVTSESSYYRYEVVGASPAVYGWQAATGWQSTPPSGYTSVGSSLPSVATAGQKVYITNIESILVSGPAGEPNVELVYKYRGYDAYLISAATGASSGWVKRTLGEVAPPVSSTRKNPDNYGTVHVTNSLPNTAYSVSVNGVVKATFTTGKGVDATTSVEPTTVIAANLGSSLTANGYTVNVIGSTISISGLSATDKITTQAGNGDRALKCYRDSVQQFTDLPPNDVEGRLVRVVGDPSVQGDDYYVQYESGLWVERVGWAEAGGFAQNTAPHVLIREANGTWTFKSYTWENRVVGDRESNPSPSFVGKKINDIFIFSNRLGLLADENLILSETDNLANFYRTTAVQTLDTDRIDIAAFTKEVNILRHAIPFAKELLLTADKGQFKLSYNGYLSPKNVSLNYVASFNASTRVKPINLGTSVYIPDDRIYYRFSKVIEFFTTQDSPDGDGDEVTAPVPEYIPSGLTFMVGSPRMKAMVLHSSQTPYTMYIYKYFIGDQGRKLQNAWSKWEFPDCTAINWADFVDNYLYMLVTRNGGLFLERINFDETVYSTATAYTVFTDRKVYKGSLGLSYNSLTDTTTVTLPYATNGIVEVVSTNTTTIGYRHSVEKLTTSSVRVDGDLTTKDQVALGIRYHMEATLPEQYLRKGQGDSQIVGEGRLQLRYIAVEVHNTPYFIAKIDVKGRDPEELEFYTEVHPLTMNKLPSDNAIVRIPIMGNARDTVISLINRGPFSSAFGSAEVQAEWSPRSRFL